MNQSRRQNGKLKKSKNTIRPNHFWKCKSCGLRVTGTQRQIENTIRVHNCGLGEDRLWLSR